MHEWDILVHIHHKKHKNSFKQGFFKIMLKNIIITNSGIYRNRFPNWSQFVIWHCGKYWERRVKRRKKGREKGKEEHEV